MPYAYRNDGARFAPVRLGYRRGALFAVASTIGAFLMRGLLPGSFAEQQPAVVFLIPIMLSAYLGGRAGGLIATGASVILSLWAMSRGADAPAMVTDRGWQELLVVIIGVFVSLLVDALHRTRKRGNVAMQRHELGERALRQSESRYEALVEWSPDPLMVQREGVILFANPAALAMLGVEGTGSVVGRHIREFIAPESIPLALHRIAQFRDGARFLPMVEMTGVRADGRKFGVEVQARAIDVDGDLAQLTSLRDISLRKAYEQEIERLSRMYSALSEINQAIVRMPGRGDLFTSVCRTLVDHGGVRAAWIHWTMDGATAIAAVASVPHDAGDGVTVSLGVDEVIGCQEPGATARREARPVIHGDMQSLSGTRAWNEAVRRSGLTGCAAFPIRKDGTVQGTLTVATNEPEFFQAKEIALLEEVARDVSFAVDLTIKEARRQAAEGALVLERDRFRSLFDYAPAGVIIADPRGRYLEVNQTMQTMVGYPRAELVGKDASLIVAARELRHIVPALVAIHTSDNYHRQWTFRRKDGSEFEAEVHSIAMPDGNLLATVQDTTDRDAADRAVRAAEERMRFALESSNIGIWDMDYVTGVLTWSEILEAHYGLAPGTFAGTFDAFMERVHPDDRRSLLSTMEKATMSGLDFVVMNRAVWPDGTVRHLRGSGRIAHDAEGRPTRGIGISIDVTSQRALEDQLHQSQKMESMGRLAGGIAHDFNNLLTIILGYCELLKLDTAAAGSQAEDIAEIQRAGRSAAELTRQLLAFSRKEIIQPTAVALSAEVQQIAVMLKRLLGDDVAIALDLEPHLGLITADRGQMEQLIINLAVNARDAMPTGGTLTIATSNVFLEDEHASRHLGVLPGEYACLVVTDTGTGMTPEVQARLFEPFFTTKPVGKGTGLGLATVHGIVARSGGSISVQSAPDRGTTFKIFFPVDEETQPEPRVERPRADTALRGRTILVVEDAKSLRELSKRFGEHLGYKVLVAADAGEALRVVAMHPEIELVLTDVVMPGWSGLELSRRIVDERPDMRLILMSGYADDAISQHGSLAADTAILSKPFTCEMLAQRLEEAFASDPRQQTAEALPA